MKTVFAVFILKNGAWVHHCTFNCTHTANHERDYLKNSLGVHAETFRKLES